MADPNSDLFKRSPIQEDVVRKSSLTESLSSFEGLTPYMPDEPNHDFNEIPEFSLDDNVFDEIMIKLTDLQTFQMDCRKELNKLMVTIEQHPHLYPYAWVFIVLYPDLLMRFLRSREYINAREYSSAVARCIQHHKTAEKEPEDWYMHSLERLLENRGKVVGTIELKIMPGKYPIDKKMYKMTALAGIRDLHYEGKAESYMYKSVKQIEGENLDVGHRDCYHALCYGGSELVEQYIQHVLKYRNCTIRHAFTDFIGVPESEDIEHTIELYRKCPKIV